ncbi:hypothetical protein Tco_1529805 [Tanacetum coccineum]
MRSGSTTTHADNSLPEYDSFHFEIELDQGELTSVVMEDILGEPRVHVPNVLPTHPTLMLDSDIIPSDDSLGSDLEVSFPSGTRNKIFDQGIFFEVQSKRFLSWDTFSISFIRNLLCLVIETLLPFSSENEDKVFNPLLMPILRLGLPYLKGVVIYCGQMFIPNNFTVLKLQTAEDLQGDVLLHYDAEMKLMNLILLSIPNDIYNSVDACTSAKDMWKRVERLMRGTIQNKVD